jgi:hypothetical protein
VGSACRKAATCTHRTAQTQNERTQTSVPQVGFEPTTPEFQRAKTVRGLDRAAAVICLAVSLHAMVGTEMRSVSYEDRGKEQAK